MRPMGREPLELLEELLRVTLAMHGEVLAGSLDHLPEYLTARQHLIDALGPLLQELGDADRSRALTLLREIVEKDEEVRRWVEELLKRELVSLKEGQKTVQAMRAFRESLGGPTSSRFIEGEG